MDEGGRRHQDGAGDHAVGRQKRQRHGVGARPRRARRARGRRPVAKLVRDRRASSASRSAMAPRRSSCSSAATAGSTASRCATTTACRPSTRKSVVLGCGGFEANVQMRTQHIGAAGRCRQGARHAAQSGRRPAHGDEHRRHALGPMERMPRHADQRRLGRLRAARTDRSQQPPELRLRRDAQPQRPPLRRRGRGRRPLHLRQVRPRHPRRARRQGLADLRLQDVSTCSSRATRRASRSPPTRWKELIEQLDFDDKAQALTDRARIQCRGTRRRGRVRSHQEGWTVEQGAGPRKDQLGAAHRQAALSMPTARRAASPSPSAASRSTENAQVDRHRLAADQGAVLLRRDGGRAILRQLSGRHRPRVGRNVRAHRGTQRRDRWLEKDTRDRRHAMAQASEARTRCRNGVSLPETIVQRLAAKVCAFDESQLTKASIAQAKACILDTDRCDAGGPAGAMHPDSSQDARRCDAPGPASCSARIGAPVPSMRP